MKEAKENWVTNQWANTDKGMRGGNRKIASDTLKKARKQKP